MTSIGRFFICIDNVYKIFLFRLMISYRSFDMKNINKKEILLILYIRKIVISFMAIIFLIWAFFKNGFVGKVIISPFIICAIAILGENIFLLLNKERISTIFKYIFLVSFFAYIFGFLIYAFYYSIITQSYSLIVVIIVFLFFAIHFLKVAFFRKK